MIENTKTTFLQILKLEFVSNFYMSWAWFPTAPSADSMVPVYMIADFG